jgi:exopolysaccharide biosynthesis WecB/TagA/CpsF family protein
MSSILVNKILTTEIEGKNNIFTKKNRVYTFLNPVSYLTALDNPKLFNLFDGIFADGSILVAAIKILYGKTVTRRSFDMTSLAPELLSYAEQNKKTIYIVASKQEQVEKAISIFKERYPYLQFSGYRNGYFSSEDEMDTEAAYITEINPDFLIVGMGVLMQEKFLLKVKSKGFQGIGFTCGGFIHQTSKNEIEYYPAWADKLNLRFIYRMYKEKHTRKRYLQAAFLFPIRFFFERVMG